MKTPRFWYKTPGLEASLLLPLTLFWRMGGGIRRMLAQPYRAQKPVVCIGNIVAGGAGKTPAVLALAEILKNGGQKPVFVTRGYGGRLHGPTLVDPASHSARDVGDEALLLARTAPVWIGRDRVAAIKEAEKNGSHVILDDGLQNPNLRPDIAFLVIDGATALGNGFLIPAGPLRETLSEAMKRITAIILVGENIEQKLAGRARCPILRANWKPDLPPDFPHADKFFAFAGIAKPEKFYETSRKAGLTLIGTEDFPDHHFFTAGELKDLRKKAETANARLLTTEKDWMRLPDDFRTKVTAFPVKLVFDDEVMIKRLLNLPE